MLNINFYIVEYMSEKLKKEFIELLEKDLEFRYIVMGYLGISDISKKLDKLVEIHTKFVENQAKIWEEIERINKNISKIWEENDRINKNISKIWEEIERINNNINKIWEEIDRINKNISKIWEEIERINKNISKIWEEIERINKNINKIWEEIERINKNISKIWEEISKIWEEIERINNNINKIWEEIKRINITLNRLTVSEEEEAFVVTSYKLKNIGIEVKLERLYIDDREINIFGITEDTCIIGEVTVRVGSKLIDELEEKVEVIKAKKPEFIRPKLIKIIYGLVVMPDALEEAKKKGIWVFSVTKEFTPLIIHKFV